MKRYQITGINKLTREREVVTVPCSKSMAEAILQREKRKSSRRRDYIHLKMQVCPPQQLCLNFNK